MCDLVEGHFYVVISGTDGSLSRFNVTCSDTNPEMTTACSQYGNWLSVTSSKAFPKVAIVL